MAYQAISRADLARILAIWKSFVPALNAAYGRANINQDRTIADLEWALKHDEEFWLSDDDAYFAMRSGRLEDGTPAWEFFEACFLPAALRNPRWDDVSREMLLAVQARGKTLGYHVAYCDTSPNLAVESKAKLVAVQMSERRMAGGKDRRVFDLDNFRMAS